MAATDVSSDAWWTREPHASLVRRLGKTPATFGELAYASPLWKTSVGRMRVWTALDQLSAAGLAKRDAGGWVADAELDELDAALGDADIEYFDRLYNKAIEVGDIKEGDHNFCGDCCYSYDDVPEPDHGQIWASTLGPVPLTAGSGTAPDRDLTWSTMRAAAGEGLLTVALAPLLLVALVSVAVWIPVAWTAEFVSRPFRRRKAG